jgi:hypothetical protein
LSSSGGSVSNLRPEAGYSVSSFSWLSSVPLVGSKLDVDHHHFHDFRINHSLSSPHSIPYVTCAVEPASFGKQIVHNGLRRYLTLLVLGRFTFKQVSYLIQDGGKLHSNLHISARQCCLAGGYQRFGETYRVHLTLKK